jgi:chemotaxis protein MotB
VSIFSAAILFGVLGLQVRQRGLALREAESALEAARQADQSASRTNETLAAELTRTREQVEELQRQVKDATEAQQELEKQMRAELESKDVTISELQGKLTVSILDRVLFDSGEAAIKPEGEAVLRKIARVLSQFPNRQIHVVGHTDNVPIRGRTPGGFANNWELSTGRAVAAVRFLHDKAGVDPRRLAAVGYGEFHPLAENSTPEGRARNRRIAVVILPEEVAPSDLPPPAARTNAPPAAAESTAGPETVPTSPK